MSSLESGRFIGKAVLSTLVLSALAACGGGGGGSNGGNTPPPPTTSRLTLTGTVTDAPIAGALVTATIGSQTFTATADANGNYRLELSVAESATGGFITLRAKGVGPQSYVEFTSLAGTFQALRTQAGSDQILSSSENFATQITNVSTALATLLQQANGGQPVASQTLIDTLTPTLNGQQILELAAAIKLLVDEPDDYPMPSGQASLQSLLANTAAREQLVSTFFAQDPALFNTVQNAIVNDTALTRPVTNATLPAMLTAVLLTDNDATTYTEQNRAISYTFNTDGTGTAAAGSWQRNMTWTISGTSIEITYESPVRDLEGWERKICPDYSSDYGYLNYGIVYDVDGAKLTLLDKHVLAVSETRHITYRDCGSFPATDVNIVARTIRNAEDFQTIDPAALRDSTRTLWVYDLPVDEFASFGILPDLAQLHADGTGTTQVFGKHFSWSLDASGRIITVSFDDGVTAKFRSLREVDDVATDLLFEFTLPTGERYVDAGASLRTDPQSELAFTPDNTIGRHYRFGIDDPPIVPGGKGTRWRFDANGIGSRESEPLNSSGTVFVVDSTIEPRYGYHWIFDGNDLLQQYTQGGSTENCDLGTPACYVSKDLRIVPLARVGTRTYVLESTRFGNPDVSQDFSRFTAIVYYEYEPLGATAVVSGKTSPPSAVAIPVRRESHILRGADHKLRNWSGAYPKLVMR